MRRILALLLSVSAVSQSSGAQRGSPSQSLTRMIDSATRLASAGQMSEARAMIDSLMHVTPSDSPQVADALFARATMAQSVLDANLDYERVIRDYPASQRRPESLLRMAQRSFVGGDNEKALEYLRTLGSDYRDDSSQAIANYWLARVFLETHQVVAACDANRRASARANSVDSWLRAQIVAQSGAVCATVVGATSRDSSDQKTSPRTSPVISPGTTTPTQRPAMYAVQVAAYANRPEAEESAARLRKSGLDAHVDGKEKPFRVRIGHYHTYAEAAAALRDLKARKLAGFVAEINQ